MWVTARPAELCFLPSQPMGFTLVPHRSSDCFPVVTVAVTMAVTSLRWALFVQADLAA